MLKKLLAAFAFVFILLNTASAQSILGDINNDGNVDAADYAIMMQQWFTGSAQGDLNGDGTVNYFEFVRTG